MDTVQKWIHTSAHPHGFLCEVKAEAAWSACCPHPHASFQDDESPEPAKRLDIILYINPGIE